MAGQTPDDPRNVILIITFIVELISGSVLLGLGVFRIRSFNKQHDKGSMYLEDPLAKPGFTQMILMGLVDIFSALVCFMKVTYNVDSKESEWLTYVQFGICTPPMIVVLCLVCSVDNDITIGLATLQFFVIVCGYLGTTTSDIGFKYTWFLLGCVFFLFLFAILLKMKNEAARTAELIVQSSPQISRQSFKKKKELQALAKQNGVLRDRELSNRLIVITLVTWSLYPVTWLIIEANTITHSTADIVHSVLAFFAKVTFGYVLAYYRAALGFETMMSTILPIIPLPSLALNSSRGRSRSGSTFDDSTSSRKEIPNLISLDGSTAMIRRSVELRKSIELRKSAELSPPE